MTNLNKVQGVSPPRLWQFPRETPAQNNEGLLVLSSVPPGTATKWRPPYLYSIDQSKQSSGVRTLAIPQGDPCSEQPDWAYQSRAQTPRDMLMRPLYCYSNV